MACNHQRERQAQEEQHADQEVGVVNRMLEASSSMQAFYDAYFFIGALFLITLPGAFLLARHAPGKHTPIQ